MLAAVLDPEPEPRVHLRRVLRSPRFDYADVASVAAVVVVASVRLRVFGRIGLIARGKAGCCDRLHTDRQHIGWRRADKEEAATYEVCVVEWGAEG